MSRFEITPSGDGLTLSRRTSKRGALVPTHHVFTLTRAETKKLIVWVLKMIMQRYVNRSHK